MRTEMPSAAHDAAASSLQALIKPGDVFEIRILHTPRGTVSGYFDDPAKAAAAVGPYVGSHNVYFTLNPVSPALMARASNRLAEYAKATTSDADILRRRWLLIDCDPVRPAGISATDTEKAAALDRAQETRAFLMSALGWPAPVVADSGNGGHLLFRTDLPNDQAARALIDSCLKALSLRFSDGAVGIDESVSNAARICKLYGTISCKGDSTLERPHRRAALLCLPDQIEVVVVAREQLDRLAATLPAPPTNDLANVSPRLQIERSATGGGIGGSEVFDIESVLAGWGVRVQRVKPWSGGTLYILEQCPFNAEHNNSSVSVLRLASGVILYKCLHDSCRHRTWPQLRAMFEPDYQARVAESVVSTDFIPVRAATTGVSRVSASAHGWEAPVPFATYDLPTFPVEALPSPVAEYVSEVSTSKQIPVDVPAMIALSAIATAAARICEVRIGDTHTEPLNLWTASVMDPGDRKSPCLEAIVAPLRDAERGMAAALAPIIEEANQKREIEEKRIGHLRAKAAKASTPEDREAMESEIAALACSLPELPGQPRLLADDVTQEKLAGLLAEQNGCMAIFSAEGGIFETLGGKYSQSSKLNLDTFLKGHAGEEVRVDRVGRPSEFIPRAMITMGLAVQLDVLQSLANTPAFRGRGLLGRFLFSIPESLVGTRLYQNRRICPQVQADYHRALASLLQLSPPQEGVTNCMGSSSGVQQSARHPLMIAGEALEQWRGYADSVELRQAPGGDLAGIKDWASKLAGAVARIAAGFSLIEHCGESQPWRSPISEECVLAAWAVGEYLIPHALAAFGLMGADSGQALAKRILAWIVRQGVCQFSFRECHQAHRTINRADVDRALVTLVDRGYIRPATLASDSSTGRPKGAIFEVNMATQNTQNTQKSV